MRKKAYVIEAQLQDLVSELNQPDRVFPVVADATDYDAINEAVERTVERFGQLDVVMSTRASPRTTI